MIPWTIRTALAITVFAMPLSAVGQKAVPFRPDQRQFRAIYQEMVETDTSITTGSCTALADKIGSRFRAAGFADTQITPFSAPDHPKESGLVVVYPGTSKTAKPMLLLGHLDVVVAKREDWQRDPYKLIETDGYFYGRGTSDMKALNAIWVDAMLRFKREGYKPKRTIKLALTCGEETGDAFNGIAWLAQNRPDLIAAEFALNEGGGGRTDGKGKLVVANMHVGEKAFENFTLEASNPGGHSSAPVRENAIYELGDALAKIRDYRFPIVFNATTRAYFAKAGAARGDETGRAMIALATNPGDKAAEAIVNRDKMLNAMLRTTCVATLIEGGHASNALPQRAKATVNCRIIPGETPAQTREALLRAVDDPRVSISPPSTGTPLAKQPPLAPGIVGPAEKLVAKYYPGVPLIPIMSSSATDGIYLQAIGIPTYGPPGLYSDPDGNNIHGENERAIVKAVYSGRDLLTELIRAYADGEGPLTSSAADVPFRSGKPRLGRWGLDLTTMDRHARPGDDFDAYVNGRWHKRTPIAADRVEVSSFTTLTDETDGKLRGIVEAAMRAPSDAAERQIGDFYASWIDEAGVEARGIGPLRPYLERIESASSPGDLVKLFAEPSLSSPIGINIAANPADPKRYAVMIGQGQLALARDYYLRQGPIYDAVRAAYRAYIVKLGILAGFSDPTGRADRIIALETRLASDQWEPARRRDLKQSINPMDRNGLQALAPRLDWAAMLDARGLPGVDQVIVHETTAVAAAAQLLFDTPIPTWKEYLAFRFVSDHARFLPKAFDDANFAFFGKVIAEQPQQRARWKRGITLINQELGEALGALYIDRYASPDAERAMTALIGDVTGAYGELIDKADWMDPATRKEAHAKLTRFEARIGHPVNYIDYSPIEIRRDDLLGNAVRAEQFRWTLLLSRFPKPVDRRLWVMKPQEVDAYYSSAANQITFPAAVLQAPFFDPAADPAVNYGSMGAVIGHEIGHGFDDQGRQFDGEGRRRDWWSSGSASRYEAKADALAKQFDQFEPIPGLHINGRLTIGENLGDLGGLQAAYAAYRRYVARHGEPPIIDGFTGTQRFFLGYAQLWQAQRRDGALRQFLLTDPHSPGKYRINGVIRNIDAWYDAFAVQPEDRLYLPPEGRIRVW